MADPRLFCLRVSLIGLKEWKELVSDLEEKSPFYPFCAGISDDITKIFKRIQGMKIRNVMSESEYELLMKDLRETNRLITEWKEKNCSLF